MNNKDLDVFAKLDLINSQADDYRLQYLKDNPYEGIKTIFIIFYNLYDYLNSKQIKKVFKIIYPDFPFSVSRWIVSSTCCSK